jgi:hypothetical protein
LEVEEEDDECSKEESDKKSPDSRCSARERKQGSKWHFACAWGSVLKKLIAQFSSFQVPPPKTFFVRGLKG